MVCVFFLAFSYAFLYVVSSYLVTIFFSERFIAYISFIALLRQLHFALFYHLFCMCFIILISCVCFFTDLLHKSNYTSVPAYRFLAPYILYGKFNKNYLSRVTTYRQQIDFWPPYICMECFSNIR